MFNQSLRIMVKEIISFAIVGILAFMFISYKLLPFYQNYLITKQEKQQEGQSIYFPRAITAMRELDLIKIIIASKSKEEKNKALEGIRRIDYQLYKRVMNKYFS